MNLFGNFFSTLVSTGDSVASGSTTSIADHSFSVNPASGLPMMDDSFDVGGNMFGTSDLFSSHTSSFDSCSSFSGDSFSSFDSSSPWE